MEDKSRATVAMGLLGVWPFASFLNHNQLDAPVYWQTVVGFAAVFLISLFMVFFVLCLVLGTSRSERIANTLAVGVVLFFNYLAVASFLSTYFAVSLGTVKIAIWLVLSLSVLVVVWVLSTRPVMSQALFAAALVMVAIPGAQLGLFFFGSGGGQTALGTESMAKGSAVSDLELVRPDVYWFILDGYTREDVLRAYFGYRNEAFLTALENRGFIVAENSYANLASTMLSVSTIENMRYYLPQDVKLHPGLWTATLQGFNPVVDRFISWGYRYVHVETGGRGTGKTRCGGREDVCISANPVGKLSLDEAAVGLLKLTAIYPIVRRLLPGFLSFDFTSLDDVRGRLSPDANKPTFAYIHILEPHIPARYKEDCSRIRFGSWDLLGTEDRNPVESYVNNVRCLNVEVIEFLDWLLGDDAGETIVIIQGDHGYRGPQDGLLAPGIEAIELDLVRFANLHAMRMPARCGNLPYPEVTAVNTFRLVFKCMGHGGFEPLPDMLFSHEGGYLQPVPLNRH